jgi:hypothetical protein
MKNSVISANMGSWTSTAPSTAAQTPPDPWRRYGTARACVARLRSEVQALIDWARAAGFNLSEALMIPAIRQALAAARAALHELAVARALLAS